MTGTERQAKLRQAREETGMVQCNVWLPVSAVADVKQAAALIRANPALTVARLVDTRTGRLRGLKP
jgi:hypothetical protein